MYLDQNAGFGVLAFLSGLWPFELGQNLQVRDRVGQVVEASWLFVEHNLSLHQHRFRQMCQCCLFNGSISDSGSQPFGLESFRALQRPEADPVQGRQLRRM